jgi:hypothetical protein
MMGWIRPPSGGNSRHSDGTGRHTPACRRPARRTWRTPRKSQRAPAGVLVVRRAGQHEVGRVSADLGTGRRQAEVAGLDVLSALFETVGHRHAEAGLVAAQALVDAGLHLFRHLVHGGLLNSRRIEFTARKGTAPDAPAGQISWRADALTRACRLCFWFRPVLVGARVPREQTVPFQGQRGSEW